MAIEPVHGDLFYDFTCTDCNGGHGDVFTRMEMTWLQTTHLAVYHLAEQYYRANPDDTSRPKYFQVSQDIRPFIDRNWPYLSPNKKRNAAWKSSIGSALTSNSKTLFKSGANVMGQLGYWGLFDHEPPIPGGPPPSKKRRVARSSASGSASRTETPVKVAPSPPNLVPPVVAAPVLDSAPVVATLKPVPAVSAAMDPAPAAVVLDPAATATTTDSFPPTTNVDPALAVTDPAAGSLTLAAALGVTTADLAPFLTDPTFVAAAPFSLDPYGSIPFGAGLTTDAAMTATMPLLPLSLDVASTMPLTLAPSMMAATTAPINYLPPSLLLYHAQNSSGPPPYYAPHLFSTSAPAVAPSDQQVPNAAVPAVVIADESSARDGVTLPDSTVTTQPSALNATNQARKALDDLDALLGSLEENGEYDATVPPMVISSSDAPASGVGEHEDRTARTAPSLPRRPQDRNDDDNDLSDLSSLSSPGAGTTASQPSTPATGPSQRSTPAASRSSSPARSAAGPFTSISKPAGWTVPPPTEWIRRCRVPNEADAERTWHMANRRNRRLLLDARKEHLGMLRSKLDLDFALHQSFRGSRRLKALARPPPPPPPAYPLLNLGHPFRATLVGPLAPADELVSPHTGRTHKTYIRRDFTGAASCPHVQMQSALRTRFDTPEDPVPASIDYCYLQPRHLVQVNAILARAFWPGIDVSESLQYPEFGVVAVYKKLVVGCALASPDGYLAYLAVLPGWTNAGIASFMLYWIAPRDVTLHVSASNPAMILYQKFGFKPEEFIVDFYDKYQPPESTDSKHAFFCRLRQ
ncbi:Cysteine-rich protein 2-binding protein [Allomyces arbusculus]|nr:Cysteine-rich protein 2-binding protein [Allomyces arbusculus]